MESSNRNPGAPAGSSQAHLAAIIDSSDDAIISKSLEGIITSWNKGAEKVFGYNAQEVIGSPISILVPPERGSEEPDILARLRRGERIDHFETVRVRKDGRRIHVSLTISPVLDERGQIIGASKIARDITDRVEAQAQTLRERERLQVMLSSIGDGVIVADPQGFIEFLNPVAESLTGWSVGEAKGKPLDLVFCIVNEATRQRADNPATRSLREGVIVGLANHTVLIGRNGSEIAIDDTAAPVRDEAGNVSGAILVFRDVSGPRAVQDFRARLSAIVENSDDAIISKDLTGKIMSWNAGAQKIFGYSQQEAVGRPITMLIPPDRLGEEADIVAKLKRGEKVDHFETVRITKDRRKVAVSLTISPIRDVQGRVVGASKIARDITEKKESERQLVEAHEKLKGHSQELEKHVAARTAELQESLAELETFSSSLSHDLKGPLRSIGLMASALIEDYGQQLPQDASGIALQITQGCRRLSRLVDNVLTYSRLRSVPVELAEVSLEQAVARVISDYPHVREANAEVTLAEPLGNVRANEPLLVQALANVFSNAVKFVAPGTRPKIAVSVEPLGARCRLWMQDNGIGIPKEDQRKVFDLFTRLDGPQQYEGSGIGLALVQRAVRRMGGDVGVESDRNAGSRFWIELERV
jgi:PAS domain S-box-containing protein